MISKVFFSLLFAAVLVGARELNVSKNGNDANSGTADAPLASIAKAANLAQPGDTVKIGPGIFRELVTFKKSGKEGAPIVFEGTRGEKGEYLTIVEAPGRTLSQWTPAPEIGPNVWKTPIENRPDIMLMDGCTMVYINKYTMQLPRWKELPTEMNEWMFWGGFGPNATRLPGFDYMRLPVDIWVRHKNFGQGKAQLWPTIGYVISGWHEGSMYLHFANDDKPEAHVFTVSYGNGFTLDGVSHLTFRNLHLRGSRKQFELKGKSSFNTIEKCLLMHGGVRVEIGKDVSNTTIRENVLTNGFINEDLFGHRSINDMRGGLLYVVFKCVIAVGSSDDIGVRDLGHNTSILDNIFTNGLIGMDAYGVGTEVAGNVVRKMSSVGICTGATTVGAFHHNLVQDCGIPLRMHNLRGERARREEYHYCNLFIQAKNAGSQMYVHTQSHLDGPDKVNFEADGKYKENPPDPVDAGKFYIYHNTFWGGVDRWAPSAFDVQSYSKKFRMQMPFFVVNNIYKDNQRLCAHTHELSAPNVLYSFLSEPVPLAERRDPNVPKVNKVLDDKETQKLWNHNDLPWLPDLSLAPNSPALEAGVDVSRPFTVNGREYSALPGFKPGYFKGKAPAAGALQEGESMQRFVEMHKRADDANKMLSELKAKTVAEARSKILKK